MARMFEDIQKVVEKLSKEDRRELLHGLDHCLLMANKFEETGKPEFFGGFLFFLPGWDWKLT
jgi:hypothetical protein